MLKAVIKQISTCVAVDSLFYQLSDGGQAPGSILYESQDEYGAYTGFSIGVFSPSVKLSGKNADFAIQALDKRGEFILSQLTLPPQVQQLQQTAQRLQGQLQADCAQSHLQARLSASNHMHIVRSLLVNIEVEESYKQLPLGLFGGFAYDFIRQFENIPHVKRDELNDDDYLFYLATRLFIVDHQQGCSYFIALIPNDEYLAEAEADITHMQNLAQSKKPLQFSDIHVGEFHSDTDKATYLATVDKLQQHIEQGDVFQVQYGRMVSAEFSGDAFKVYHTLKHINNSPYMFYMRDEAGVLLGSSPELNVSVKNDTEARRRVTITPIAGTKPRGFRDGKICPELDARYVIALQTDQKELAEHVMLIDLVRNDIASIAKPGTTLVRESFAIKRFSHVQHLVSRVDGELRDDVDALTAYLATMNMGTLTGAPKVEAMRLIAEVEENEHGFFGGGFGFITHDGHCETTIVIRSMRIKHGKVYCRAAAGIVADSVPLSEFCETEAKMQACIKALQQAAIDA